MSNLSFEGRQAILPYIEQVLAPDSSGQIDTNAITANPDISDGDLAHMIEHIGYAFDRPKLETSGFDRQKLVKTFGEIIDQVTSSPELYAIGDVTVNPSRTWQGQFDNSAVHGSSPRISGIMGGVTGNVTHRILRALRFAQGWVPMTRVENIVKLYSNDRHSVINTLRHSYMDRAIAAGATPEEAENAAQKNYIAITQHYYKEGIGHIPDIEHPSQQWIDLSPQAVADIEQLAKRRVDEKADSISMVHLLKDLDMPNQAPDSFIKVVEGLREKEIARLIKDESLTPLEAQKRTDETYIRKTVRPQTTVYLFHPRGVQDIKVSGVCEAYKEQKKTIANGTTFTALCHKFNIFSKPQRDMASSLLLTLQQEKIEKFTQEQIPLAEATEKTEKDYIKITPLATYTRYILQPEAVRDFEARFQGLFPHHRIPTNSQSLGR